MENTSPEESLALQMMNALCIEMVIYLFQCKVLGVLKKNMNKRFFKLRNTEVDHTIARKQYKIFT